MSLNTITKEGTVDTCIKQSGNWEKTDKSTKWPLTKAVIDILKPLSAHLKNEVS